ncbi:coproporphyrinogen III oxidase [uncultured Clostridium sp.]|uniref:coproporphyrinogen III oxidase n=1 Tax=uncultured Clostridium sp. TaxID=59620 RepID=UPI0025EC6E97|nr:coproporphyrinogen III oxidase [uncultured Clostridium sp.]
MRIKLSEETYRYEIYHTVAIFYGYNEVEVVDSNEDFYIKVNPFSIEIVGEGKNFVYNFLEDIPLKTNIRNGIFKFFSEITKVEIPWGTIVGIRPTKKVILLKEQGLSDEDIVEYMKKYHFTREEKTRLCLDVVNKEIEFVNKDKNTISIYIGMAFCPTKCLYCSFTSNPISSNKTLVFPYLEALMKEIDFVREYVKKKSLNIETVYFGGGTPTSVNEKEFELVMNNIYNSFIRDYSIKEFTVECGRPDSITRGKLEIMKNCNVSRISINPQTMNNDTLRAIGRGHTAEDVIEKFNLARELGFDNINMDLIVGLPGEGYSHIDNTIAAIEKLKPEGITVHGLSIKKGSNLERLILQGKLSAEPNLEEILYSYKKINELATKLNMKPYYMYRQKNMVGNMENVGFSIEGHEGIYNIEMIEEKQNIIAIGSDAVSKIIFNDENRLERFPNLKDVREYVNRIDELISRKEKFLNERW